jgi:hypothetical protein
LLRNDRFSFAIAAKIACNNDLRVGSEKQLRELENDGVTSQMNRTLSSTASTQFLFILQNLFKMQTPISICRELNSSNQI